MHGRRNDVQDGPQQGRAAPDPNWDIKRVELNQKIYGIERDERSLSVRGWSQIFNQNPALTAPVFVPPPTPGSAGGGIGPGAPGASAAIFTASPNFGTAPLNAGAPWRGVDFVAEMQGCMTISTDQDNPVLVNIEGLRESAQIIRGSPRNQQIIVPPWGIALPFGAGHIIANVTVAPNGGAPANTLQSVYVSYSIGVPVIERYQVADITIPAAGFIDVIPVDFARLMTIVNCSSNPMNVSPKFTLASSTEATFAAAVRRITGTPTDVFSLFWEVIGP